MPQLPLTEINGQMYYTPEDQEMVDAREFLPNSYLVGAETDEKGHLVPTVEAMVEGMREDLYDEEAIKTDYFMGRFYGVSREIGDKAISDLERQQGGSAVAELLDETRHKARPENVRYTDTENIAELEYGERSNINIGPKLIDAAKDAAFADNLKQNNVELRHPNDARLIRLMRVMAHESGHALTFGIGSKIRHTDSQKSYTTTSMATEAYLAQHPEKSLTGRWRSDVQTQEERIAEGYSVVVMGQLLKGMGYSKREAKVITKEIAFDPHFGGERGTNPIDRIQSGLGAAAVSAEVDFDGHLGYALPLKTDELLDTLAEMQTFTTRSGEVVSGMTQERWTNMVGMVGKDPTEHRYLKQIQRGRKAVTREIDRGLDPVAAKEMAAKKAHFRRFVGKTVLSAAVALGVLLPAKHVYIAHEQQQQIEKHEQDLQKIFDEHNKNRQFTVETGDSENPFGE